ncbi:MAG: hypothetical protein ACREJ6_07605 [Candidatus Methylomirabilis sp.]
MKKRLIVAALSVVVVALLALNIRLAFAHQWWAWHFHSPINILVSPWNSHFQQHIAAAADWDSHVSDLKLRVNFKQHTDVSMLDGNYGATGWWGLASIEGYTYDWWHWWCWCLITHAHATFNNYYGGSAADIQGVQCQEVGHTFGLDHSNTGDCMGKGYFNNINVTGPHNWADINAMY